MYGPTIDSLIRSGVVVLLHDYRSGSAQDWSGQGNVGTLSAGCKFTGPSGALRFPATTDEVTVADVAALRLTTFSVVVVIDCTSQTATEYLVSHDSAGSGYSLGLNATQLLLTGDGVARTIAATLTGARSLGATCASGGTPIGYKDGLSLGNFSGAVTVTGAAVATEIGNWNNSGQCKSAEKALLIANRILTPTEMAAVHAELVNAKWPSKQTAIARRVQGSVIGEDGLVAGWSMRPVGGAVVDVVGAHNGTIYGSVAKQGILGYEQTFDGTDDYIDCGNVGSIKTMAFWCRPTTTTEDIADMDGGTHTVEVGAGTLTATGWNAPIIYVNGAASTALRAGVLQRVVITTATAFNATALQLGTETTFFDGQIGEVEVFSDEKSSAWVAADYAEGAKAIQFKTDWGYNISPANEGGVTGQQIGGNASPFRAGDATGRWAVKTDTIDGRLCKVLTCKTAGSVYIPAAYFANTTPTEAAFGTFEAWLYRTGLRIDWSFISPTDFAGFNPAASYKLYLAAGNTLIYETLVGAIITGTPLAADAWHRFRITRNIAGGFALYVDGVADGTGTDVTTTVSKYMVFYMSAGDKLALGDVGGNHGLVKMLGVVAP